MRTNLVRTFHTVLSHYTESAYTACSMTHHFDYWTIYINPKGNKEKNHFSWKSTKVCMRCIYSWICTREKVAYFFTLIKYIRMPRLMSNSICITNLCTIINLVVHVQPRVWILRCQSSNFRHEITLFGT